MSAIIGIGIGLDPKVTLATANDEYHGHTIPYGVYNNWQLDCLLTACVS